MMSICLKLPPLTLCLPQAAAALCLTLALFPLSLPLLAPPLPLSVCYFTFPQQPHQTCRKQSNNFRLAEKWKAAAAVAVSADQLDCGRVISQGKHWVQQDKRKKERKMCFHSVRLLSQLMMLNRNDVTRTRSPTLPLSLCILLALALSFPLLLSFSLSFSPSFSFLSLPYPPPLSFSLIVPPPTLSFVFKLSRSWKI